ncbi:hypothetical protein LJR029_006337 [Caballeronia sp. LjRoot29]|uniref:hypothetical protein n=1 Tax=Caballeronia sp. LjRoot29 TaxID=3342315 RepID=UPI003ED1001C
MTTSAQPTPVYEERYVLFADMLGFTNIIREGRWTPQQVLSALEKARKVTAPDYAAISTTQFSDSIVMSAPVDDLGFLNLVFSAFFLSIELVQNGILMRGGIARGAMYHDGDFAFGPAFIDAYELERTARTPRILIEKGLFESARWPDTMSEEEICEVGHDHLPRDDDGRRYIDYFSHIHQGEFDEGLNGLLPHHAALDTMVAQYLRSPEESIINKYRWIAAKLAAARERMHAQWGEHD